MPPTAQLSTPRLDPGPPVPVLLIHPHDVTRFGLEHAWSLSGEVDVVASFDHWSAAIDLLDKPTLANPQPRVVLIGLWPQAIEPIDVIKLMQLFDQPAWMIMSPEPAATEWNALEQAGARGYLHQMALTSRVTSAIQWVDAGRDVVDPSLAIQPALSVQFDRITKTIRRTPASADEAVLLSELSSRELEVIDGLAMGLTNQQIAERMFLSVKTIETYRSRLCRKLKVRDRASIVAIHRQSVAPLGRVSTPHSNRSSATISID